MRITLWTLALTSIVTFGAFGTASAKAQNHKNGAAVHADAVAKILAQVETQKTSTTQTLDSKWTGQFDVNWSGLSTVLPGAEGTGSGFYVGFRLNTPQTPVGQFSNTFEYWHVNTITRYPGPNGTTWTSPYTFYSYEDVVQYDFGPPQCRWGVGPGWYSEHPIGQIYNYSTSGFGVGIDKLQSPFQGYSLSGGFHYYPTISGGPNGNTQSYQFLRVNARLSYLADIQSHFSIYIGFTNDTYIPKTNSAGNTRIFGGYAGVGYKF